MATIRACVSRAGSAKRVSEEERKGAIENERDTPFGENEDESGRCGFVVRISGRTGVGQLEKLHINVNGYVSVGPVGERGSRLLRPLPVLRLLKGSPMRPDRRDRFSLLSVVCPPVTICAGRRKVGSARDAFRG